MNWQVRVGVRVRAGGRLSKCGCQRGKDEAAGGRKIAFDRFSNRLVVEEPCASGKLQASSGLE